LSELYATFLPPLFTFAIHLESYLTGLLYIIRPLFSSDSINCNKHKMERFLHHGRFSVASVYAPICFPPLPLIVLKSRDGEQPAIAAVGSLKSVDPDRIILKKIVLTG
jgi:pre-rRNA-processing protein TSR1